MTKFIGVFHSVFMKAHKTNSKVDEFVNWADIDETRVEGPDAPG